MKKSFREQVLDNYKEVQKWPLWKRNIVISAKAASTGNFIEQKDEV